MNRRDFIFSALALSGCATAPVISTDTLVFQELEPLFDVRVGRLGLTFSMMSGGCTSKANTVFYVQQDDRVSELAFARRKVDRCQTPDEAPVELHFTWTELGLRERGRVVLLNPTRG
jgi:hypothetical protein